MWYTIPMDDVAILLYPIAHRLGNKSSFLTSTRNHFYLHLLRMLRNYKLKTEHSY